MAAPKGHKRYGGRQKGTPNKLTKSVKDALAEAFSLVGDVNALVTWAKKNPTEFYKLWAKLLPTQLEVSGPDRGPVVTEMVIEHHDTEATPTLDAPAGGDSQRQAETAVPPRADPGLAVNGSLPARSGGHP